MKEQSKSAVTTTRVPMLAVVWVVLGLFLFTIMSITAAEGNWGAFVPTAGVMFMIAVLYILLVLSEISAKRDR